MDAGTSWYFQYVSEECYIAYSNESAIGKSFVLRREGFSLLFYGFGSKKKLLEKFAREQLLDGGVLVFNGFVPTLTLREVLSKVATMLRRPRWAAVTVQLCCCIMQLCFSRLYRALWSVKMPPLQMNVPILLESPLCLPNVLQMSPLDSPS
jgi:hypothetical protein